MYFKPILVYVYYKIGKTIETYMNNTFFSKNYVNSISNSLKNFFFMFFTILNENCNYIVQKTV